MAPYACAARGAFVGGAPRLINVTGAGSNAIPANGSAAAAVLNLTGVTGTTSTFLSVYPPTPSGTCGTPQVSNLNISAGRVQANRVEVALGPATSGGPDTSICVYNSVGSINVVLDVNGWFGSGSAAPGDQYQPIGPSRVCDTRTGSGQPCAGHPVASNHGETVQVASVGGLPPMGAANPPLAVVANLTAVAPGAGTYLTLYAADLTTEAGGLRPQRQSRSDDRQSCGRGVEQRRRSRRPVQRSEQHQCRARHRGLVPVGSHPDTVIAMWRWSLTLPEHAVAKRRRADAQAWPEQVLLRVHVCGVCRTDLHVVDGELTDPKLPLIPGHQIVGDGGRTGAAEDLRRRSGRRSLARLDLWRLRYCRSGRENLCDRARFTGYDIDGGYAEYAVADAALLLPVSAAPTRDARRRRCLRRTDRISLAAHGR